MFILELNSSFRTEILPQMYLYMDAVNLPMKRLDRSDKTIVLPVSVWCTSLSGHVCVIVCCFLVAVVEFLLQPAFRR